VITEDVVKRIMRVVRIVRSARGGPTALLAAALTLAASARPAPVPAADRTAAAVAAPGTASPDTNASAGQGGPQSSQPPAPPQSSASARIFLTWHAPYGQPRASDQLFAACGDTSGLDTLYMCLDPGRDTDHLVGITATVYFWAAAGETLGTHWSFGDGQDFERLRVEFNPASVPGVEPVCPEAAVARAAYTRTVASGKLLLIVAVPEAQGRSIRGGTMYALARVLVPRPQSRFPGCDRGICIEWTFSSIAYDVADEPQINHGQKFVSWNSVNGKSCAPLRQFSAPSPWKPPPQPRKH
jgi:hypothetical protein